MHTHAEVAGGCNISLLYYNYGTERGPSTVARLVIDYIIYGLVKVFNFRIGPFMFSDSPSYLAYWLGHCQAYATNRIDSTYTSLFTSKLKVSPW